ncbi:AsnC family transcriptional regulator [Thermanaerosceptrum fracticalcis]|uniref:siroheme decarboxylase n=1 Tax=Thermanaerosceptrum fracticalcis TaxID=1712410 RepID=A0A7G6E7Q4_THEFR|nr:AsnC family transcriptional regulator [Thermanaerosceptrum fracticalcis]QNB48108.1 AsnC family transcriptional regulator [Thermanaerosceptrum fracticalcis]
MTVDNLDKELLTLIQSDFPISPRPYLDLAIQLGITEEEVITRLRKMSEEGLIRRIGAIFDSRALGYTSTLCAMEVPEERIAETARVINSYPGVTHNYTRQHDYNLWFTLITPSPEVLQQIIGEIEKKTGLKVYNLPALKLFKIKVNFTVPGREEKSHAL